MKSNVEIAKQKEFLDALLPPLTGLIALVIGYVMLLVMDPFGQPEGSQAVETFALSLVLMSVVTYFAVPFIGNKIGNYLIMKRSKAAE